MMLTKDSLYHEQQCQNCSFNEKFNHKQDSSEEEEEGDNEYDLTDKFLADDGEEEEGNASEGEKERRRRHKRRRERSPELDEEDYELLEENQVTVSLFPDNPHAE